MNGVIWNKIQGAFVPISSVPVYAMMQQERLRQSRALETYNFKLQNLTLTSFQDQILFEFYDNDRKVTGLCGELWNILSELLNFTLQPVRSNVTGLGLSNKNYTFEQGLLGIITRNETIAIPMVETYTVRLAAVDFTIPLWMNSYRLYIRQEGIHDSAWMTKVFSWKIWCIVLVMHLLLTVCSFWSQIILSRIENKYKCATFGEHLFYNFGMLCNQSYIPEILDGRSRILGTSLGFFCSVLYMAFGAVLFIYMSKKIVIPPFDNLNTLITDTKYTVINLKDTIADFAFQKGANKEFAQVRDLKRVITASTNEELFKTVCNSTKKKYALFQGDDECKTREEIICRLTPIGRSYLKMWISVGIVKNFKYKRTIDLGILRLKEVGLWNGLKDRWFKHKTGYDNDVNTMEAIKMDQVLLAIVIMCCGMVIAFIIFIIEKIVFIKCL